MVCYLKGWHCERQRNIQFELFEVYESFQVRSGGGTADLLWGRKYSFDPNFNIGRGERQFVPRFRRLLGL